MIQITNKEDCCGCTACESKCPKRCISMRQDSEGFLYPFVDIEKCVDCRVCEIVCPISQDKKKYAEIFSAKEDVIHKAIMETNALPKSYICFNANNEIRQKSTSGGFFSAIANYVIDRKGVVFGVVLDSNYNVVHIMGENSEALEKMRQSKYVQSFKNGTYTQVEEQLKKGRLVFFTGTPCEVVGLKNYLGIEYENLITMDVFCHGVGSPLYWKTYISFMKNKYRSPIEKICFREKTYGYNSPTLAVYFRNGKSCHNGHNDDLYWSPFSKNYIFRPSCYACAFKQVNRVSDFSVGDFWDTNGLSKEFGKANGCSLLLCHSNKAQLILNSVKETLIIKDCKLETSLIINGGHQPSMLIASPSCPEKRAEFFKDMEYLNPLQLNKKYFPLSLKEKAKCVAKPILYKLGILKFAKRIIRKEGKQ